VLAADAVQSSTTILVFLSATTPCWVTTDEGAPRYRVDWNEQGHTWEADGEPYTDVNEFLALLDHVRILDQASWEATLPNGVAATILANTDKGVSWYPDKGVACFGPQQSMPCN